MAKEEYEFVPTKEFNKLSEELEQIKKNPFLSKAQSKDMKGSIDDLHTSIKGLLELLKLAHQDMTIEEREEKILKKEISPILKRFDKIEENQETIANGIVLVSDTVTKLSHKVSELTSVLDELKRPPVESDSKRTVTRKVLTTKSNPQVGLPQFNNQGAYAQPSGMNGPGAFNSPPPMPNPPANQPGSGQQMSPPPTAPSNPSPSAPPAPSGNSEEYKHKGLFGKK